MSAHTPGPWIWSGNVVLGAHESHPVASGRGNVASVGFYADAKKRTLTERQEANARLIAAAPDLLDALKGAYAGMNYQKLVREATGEATGAYYELLRQQCDQARAAIVKAQGGAQ